MFVAHTPGQQWVARSAEADRGPVNIITLTLVAS